MDKHEKEDKKALDSFFRTETDTMIIVDIRIIILIKTLLLISNIKTIRIVYKMDIT